MFICSTNTSRPYIWPIYFWGSNMSARQRQLICSLYMLNHLKYTWKSALFNFFRNQNICHLQAFGVTKLVVDCSATFRNQMWTEVYLVLPAFLITFYIYFQEGISLCDQRLSLAAFSSPDDVAFLITFIAMFVQWRTEKGQHTFSSR